MSWQPRVPTYQLPRTERKEQESLPDFAERHGWQVRHYPNESAGYYQSYRFRKDGRTIDVSLWNDRQAQVATADVFAIAIPQSLTQTEIRSRIERAIVGMDCTCTVTETYVGLDRRVDPKCLIHAQTEAAPIADVRNIDVEQATQEQLSV